MKSLSVANQMKVVEYSGGTLGVCCARCLLYVIFQNKVGIVTRTETLNSEA